MAVNGEQAGAGLDLSQLEFMRPGEEFCSGGTCYGLAGLAVGDETKVVLADMKPGGTEGEWPHIVLDGDEANSLIRYYKGETEYSFPPDLKYDYSLTSPDNVDATRMGDLVTTYRHPSTDHVLRMTFAEDDALRAAARAGQYDHLIAA